MKLLLHTCCGPCFLGVWEDLDKENISVTGFFYNPNIQPTEEYLKRKKYLKKAAKGKLNKILEIGYHSEEHAQAIKGEEKKFPKRCLRCYRLRLKKTAEIAKKEGFDLFSTTLLVSPYQNHEQLRIIGEEIAGEVDIAFYYRDWRPYFRNGQNLAREMGIYSQRYCGCSYSSGGK